jgi:hypothetical protein
LALPLLLHTTLNTLLLQVVVGVAGLLVDLTYPVQVVAVLGVT